MFNAITEMTLVCKVKPRHRNKNTNRSTVRLTLRSRVLKFLFCTTRRLACTTNPDKTPSDADRPEGPPTTKAELLPLLTFHCAREQAASERCSSTLPCVPHPSPTTTHPPTSPESVPHHAPSPTHSLCPKSPRTVVP